MSTTDPAAIHGELREAPPSGGLPFFGHFFEVRRDMVGGLDRLRKRFGPAFWGALPGMRVLVLLGPEANELVLHDRAGNYANGPGWEPFLGRIFPGALLSMDGVPHRHARRLMQGAFSRRALAGYLDLMTQTIAGGLAGWGAGARAFELPVYPALKRLTLDVASRALMGIELGPQAASLNRDFIDMVGGTFSPIPWAIPGTPLWRGVRARRRLVRALAPLIPARREAEGEDLLTRLCNASSEEGERFSDREVIDHLAFLMMAAHDTSTTALTTMIYLLARDQRWQDRLREESLARGPEPVDVDGEALAPLTWTFKEALRLYPPVSSMPRQAIREHSFLGFRVPAGATVGAYPVHTHHMPEIWTDPARFDPERFAEHRREDRRHPGAFVPFGGGVHLCIGLHFGGLEVREVMHQLVRTLRWRVPDGYTMPYERLPIGYPRDGLPVLFERLT
ncbi:MAG: cytochrome P450 [Myxococcales bacterium]|nr:cytochrome P450 [Myxococcales bacterium]